MGINCAAKWSDEMALELAKIDLTELKESLSLLYAVVGQDMPAIGMIGLKLVDVVEDICDGRDPEADLQHICAYSYYTVLGAMVDRARTFSLDDTISDLGSAMLVQGTWEEKKLAYLKAIANAHRAFAQKTGCKYPDVVTRDGTVL